MELLYILFLLFPPTLQEEMKAKKVESIFSDNTSQFCDISLREKKTNQFSQLLICSCMSFVSQKIRHLQNRENRLYKKS